MDKLSLCGKWNYIIDKEDIGIKEGYNLTKFRLNEFNMPGTTNSNGIGTKLDESILDSKESVKCIREKYNYLGVMWYQKEITIQEDFLDQEVELFFERVMFESTLYVNGQIVGKNSSLSTPHRYLVSKYLSVGKNLITLRIDNRDVEGIGAYASAMTVDTSTVWNGVIGQLSLSKKPLIDIENIKIFPDLKNAKIRVTYQAINYKSENNEIAMNIYAKCKDKSHESISYNINLKNKDQYELEYKMNDFLKWDEFTPNVYTLYISSDLFQKEVTFGMRDIKTEKQQILINNRPTFFMGTLECSIFPLTGYPAVDRESWEKIMKALKEYGLNHIRFHSWTPPEMAFTVADELGVYIQTEGPLWIDGWQGQRIGTNPNHYKYIPEENQRIIDEFGNHPSLVIFSNGNELTGDFELLSKTIHDIKKNDKRFLYTLTSNWDRNLDKEDDIFISQTVDGVGIRGQYFHNEMATKTTLEFSKGINLRDVPIITHEVGQYTVFPNIHEIPKYEGVLEPTNLKYIKNVLDEKGLTHLARKYTLNSGKTSYRLYRDEIEAALRTKNLAGIQLLDLHDFPGQSTATVGILDCFWDSKNLVSSRRFREFTDRIVPLLKMDKRIFKSGEKTRFGVSVSHYGEFDIEDTSITFELWNGNLIHSETIKIKNIKQGNVYDYGSVDITLPRTVSSEMFGCVLKIDGTSYRNNWEIFVFPDTPVEETLIFDTLSDDFIEAVKQGKRIIFNPKAKYVKDAIQGSFFPVFWSPVHFTSDNPNGLVISNDHPIFNLFETSDFANYQWKNLLDSSVNINITKKGIEPIIDVIPNFIISERMTNLFEVKIHDSIIVVTTIDIMNNLDYRLEAKQLRASIADYMKRPNSHIPNEMSLDDFLGFFYKEDQQVVTKKLFGVEIGKGKHSTASSEDENHKAYLGNNGLNYTYWCADDFDKGHHYEIDLGEDHLIYGTKVTFHLEENYLYAIRASSNNINYKTVVNQTGQTSKERVRTDLFNIKARYIQIVYSGLPKDVRAGHFSFEIFGE